MYQESIHDLIGVGFGPSNIALAIALAEQAPHSPAAVNALYLERQPTFAWHGDMLLPGSDMQISFMKDLVSLRNPQSPFSFVSYLHGKGRLSAFINRQTFTPSRVEFNDYLCWVAGHFADRCRYGEDVVAIEPELSDKVVGCLRVHSLDRDGQRRVRRARNLSLALGALPRVPPVFAGLAGDRRVVHTATFLDGMARLDLAGRDDVTVAVIGGGQSGAEIFADLQARLPRARLHMIMPAAAMRPADDSPFANEIFDPAATDRVFGLTESARQDFLRTFRNTNYSVVDRDLIERIYDTMYEQQVRGEDRLAIHGGCAITEATADAGGVELCLTRLGDGVSRTMRYDAVVLCTGYDRNRGETLLAGVAQYLPGMRVGRDYRLESTPDFQPAIFLQGCSEATHGLSDSLLSVISVRAREIVEALTGCQGADTLVAAQ